jgi:hypothetical protein
MAAAGLTEPRCASERGLAMGGGRPAEHRFTVGGSGKSVARCRRTVLAYWKFESISLQEKSTANLALAVPRAVDCDLKAASWAPLTPANAELDEASRPARGNLWSATEVSRTLAGRQASSSISGRLRITGK